MWNISTYQWLQGIRYYTEPYGDQTEIFTVTYLEEIPAELDAFVMKVKSMENLKLTCESYTHCLVPAERKSSTEKTFNSAYFAKLLIQELVTQKRLSANLKHDETNVLDGTDKVLNDQWSTDEEVPIKTTTLLEETNCWSMEENDLYDLSACLQVVDDSFEDILNGSTSPEPPTHILDCADERTTCEYKHIPQSAIYQNIFELRKEVLLKQGGTGTKRHCLYENIWDFASATTALDIKHGNLSRVSTMFDETCQELVVPVVRPLRCDLEFYMPGCVSQWMKDLRYDYCWEDDERDKTMATQQQSQMYHGSPSNVNKNSQHNLVPKSPTKFGDSNEDNQNTQKTSTNRKSIKNILQKFLNRRPSQQELVTKGIIQDQQIFGNSLRNLCKSLPAGRKVPEFVSAVMCMIQAPCNVVSHGIYRASGNIATIQKIRFRVNEGKNLDILKEYRNDVDVLTGSLKLFFRELTEPLISTHMLQDLCALKDRELTDHDRLLSEADKIIKRQPDYHRDVLTELINHILYVNSFGDKNSMSIDSMSIVWGPSLIFTDNEDSGMLLQRITNNNSIVKFLLNIYNADYIPSKHIPPQRLYSSESTLSLASTSDKGSTSRPSLKQQHSVDDSLCIDDLELLIKSIQDSELAKKMNVYVMYKGKKSKKIIDRIKAKKSIEKYTTTKDGLCGIVETLKSFVYHSAVVPEDFLRNYDGGTLSKKQIEAALDQLPTTNQRILSLVLNHLNDMQKINPEKYSLNLLLESWIKVLFMNHQANANAFKCFEQLLVYYQSSKQFQIDQTAHQKHMMSDLNDNLQLRGRLSVCESFLDDEDFQPDRISTDSAADVEIRKSQLYIVREEQERRKNNRNS